LSRSRSTCGRFSLRPASRVSIATPCVTKEPSAGYSVRLERARSTFWWGRKWWPKDTTSTVSLWLELLPLMRNCGSLTFARRREARKHYSLVSANREVFSIAKAARDQGLGAGGRPVGSAETRIPFSLLAEIQAASATQWAFE